MSFEKLTLWLIGEKSARRPGNIFMICCAYPILAGSLILAVILIAAIINGKI